MKKIIITLLGLMILVSCSTFRNKGNEAQTSANTVIQDNSADPLESARSFVELARRAEAVGDTLGAEYYFGKAMDITGHIQEEKGQTLDSLTLRQVQEISLEYARYLARLNGIEHDTLTAANVMKALDSIQDTTTAGVTDSAVVLVPDVIEDTTVMAIPLVLNKKVENAISYFQGKGRRVFTKWLQRRGKYEKLIKQILREEGVPEELLHLAMIESGFNPFARSYARAVGMWQFIYSTGRAYGLHQSWWYDERQDPEKATRAAARHLRDLYERFDNWYLAIAGYNFSPGKIEYRMRRYKVNEFWDLPRLPRQTRNYVPTFIAATLMASNPEKYGFYVEPESPLAFDTVTVRECVDLNVVASCVNSSFEVIKKLNPSLLRWCTPPDQKKWVLNIPEGSRELFNTNYAKVPDDQKVSYVHHRIRKGETLSGIARHYGVTISELKRFNNIRGSLIRAGHSLVLPVPQNKNYTARTTSSTARRTYTPKNHAVSNVPGRKKKIHQVRYGESLWSIATHYGVTITQIRKWNGLGRYTRIIKPGQKLNVWLPPNSSALAANQPRQTNSSSNSGLSLIHI